MKRHTIATLLVVSALGFVVSMTLVAQDRSGIKEANGIALSEFAGYDGWQVIATSDPDNAGGCGTSKIGCTKVILGNAVMIKAYRDGFPANGKPIPDGAAMAKVEWLKARNPASPYGVSVPGAQTEVSFMAKDSKRFPETNGWGYATFQRDAESDAFKPAHTDPSFNRTLCHQCHTHGAKARDFVYTSYAQR